MIDARRKYDFSQSFLSNLTVDKIFESVPAIEVVNNVILAWLLRLE
jgi:hypothetical protein